MMTRLVYFALLVGLVIAFPLSHTAMSKKKGKGPARIEICHFPDDGPGHVIEVSRAAVPAHIEKHGDCTTFSENADTGECTCNVIGPGG